MCIEKQNPEADLGSDVHVRVGVVIVRIPFRC